MRTTLVALLVLVVVARAEDSLAAALTALRVAPAKDSDAAVQAVLALKPERAAVLNALRKPLAVVATKAG